MVGRQSRVPLGVAGHLHDHLPLARIMAIARSGRGVDASQQLEHTRRTSAITAVHHRLALATPDLQLLVHGGWRSSARQPLELFAGGVGVVLAGRPGSAWVTLHAGSRARPLTAHELMAALEERFTAWCLVRVSLDTVVSDRGPVRDPLAPPTLDDGLLGAWEGPLAWVVTARPMPAARVRELIEADIQRAWERARARGGERYVDALVHREQLEGVARYLRRSLGHGLWEVEVRAGAASEEEAAQVAALLASSIDASELPYVLAVLLPNSLSEIGDPAPWEGAVSSEMLARLCALPVSEVPGVRVFLRSTFDVTPEPIADDVSDQRARAVSLGDVLDREGRAAGDFQIPLSTLNRHAFICGATGSGKSHTTRHLLAQLAELEVPWLVIEPAKAEYRRMVRRVPLVVIRPGDVDSVPVGINPLEPEPGFPLQTHVDLVRALFVASFQAAEPFPQVLTASLTRCYEDLGWDLVRGRQRPPQPSPIYPSLASLQAMARRVVEEVGYASDVRRNVTGFMEVRLSSLRFGTTGRFFEGGHALDMGALLRHNCVVEIEDVGDDQDKAFLIGTFLIRLTEHLRVRERLAPSGTVQLRHLTVIEEAHRLLRRHDRLGPAAMAVEMFASLIAEVRAYGEGIVVAEQIPNKIVPDVIKNSALKVIHRLPAIDDRSVVGATVNLDDVQSETVVALNPGQAAVARDGMDHPVLVQVTHSETLSGAVTSGQSAEALVGRFACGAQCQKGRCTLDHMRRAELLMLDDGLVLWVELAVVAHLTGWTVPRLRERLFERLTAMDDHLRSCGIRRAVRAAVASRAVAILPSMPPEELTKHVAGDLQAQLDGSAGADAPQAQWIAREFRWQALRRHLSAWIERGGGAEPLPETEQWAVALDELLPHTAAVEQHAWTGKRVHRSDPSLLRELLLGSVVPSAIERVAGVSAESTDWRVRLGRRLEAIELRPDWSPYIVQQLHVR